MKSTEVNCRSLPRYHFSLKKCTQVCPPHVALLIFVGNLTGNPCFKPPSCHTQFDTLTWCCKHSFYLDLYLSFDLLYVLLPIECMLLIAVFSCLKRAFVFDFFFYFCRFHFIFFMNTWLMRSVWNCLVLDAWTLFAHWHQFYIWLD